MSYFPYDLCDMKLEYNYNQIVFCIESNITLVSNLALKKNETSFWVKWGNEIKKYDYKDLLYMRNRDLEYGNATICNT